MIKKYQLWKMIWWEWKALEYFHNQIYRGMAWEFAYRETQRKRALNHFKNEN